MFVWLEVFHVRRAAESPRRRPSAYSELYEWLLRNLNLNLKLEKVLTCTWLFMQRQWNLYRMLISACLWFLLSDMVLIWSQGETVALCVLSNHSPEQFPFFFFLHTKHIYKKTNKQNHFPPMLLVPFILWGVKHKYFSEVDLFWSSDCDLEGKREASHDFKACSLHSRRAK